MVRRKRAVSEHTFYHNHSTSNRAALECVLEVLGPITVPCSITIRTNSRYVIDCLTRWAPCWEANGWLSTSGTEVLNRDLLEAIWEFMQAHRIRFRLVKGDAIEPDFERCHELAADTLRRERAVGVAP